MGRRVPAKAARKFEIYRAERTKLKQGIKMQRGTYSTRHQSPKLACFSTSESNSLSLRGLLRRVAAGDSSTSDDLRHDRCLTSTSSGTASTKNQNETHHLKRAHAKRQKRSENEGNKLRTRNHRLTHRVLAVQIHCV